MLTKSILVSPLKLNPKNYQQYPKKAFALVKIGHDIQIFRAKQEKILEKILRTLSGDIWTFTKVYNISEIKFSTEIVPVLVIVQTLVYIADFIVEESQEKDNLIKSDLKKIFDAIINYLAKNNIRSDELKNLFEDVYYFLLKDRQVHNFYGQNTKNRPKPFCQDKNEIFKILNSKVSDLVALMKITVAIVNIKVPENEWLIWRQIEFVREFFDDYEDMKEDSDKFHEQFNSIIQMKKLKLNIKAIIQAECQKLHEMIINLKNQDKQQKFLTIYQSRISAWLAQIQF